MSDRFYSERHETFGTVIKDSNAPLPPSGTTPRGETPAPRFRTVAAYVAPYVLEQILDALNGIEANNG